MVPELGRRDRLPTPVFLGFSGGSEGKESACNERDLGSIPGLGRSPGEGNSYMCVCVCVCFKFFLQKGIIQDTLLVVNFMAPPSRSDHAFFFL